MLPRFSALASEPKQPMPRDEPPESVFAVIGSRSGREAYRLGRARIGLDRRENKKTNPAGAGFVTL